MLPPVADHCPTIMQLRLSRPREHGRQCTFRDFERGNLSGLTNFLLNVDWSLVYSAQDPEVALYIWYDIYLSAVNRFVPETTVTIRPNNKPWYTAHLHRLRRQQDRLFCRCKVFPSEHRLHALYRRVRNWYVSELRHAERSYHRRMQCHLSDRELRDNPHRWWSTAKAACGLQSHDKIPPLRSNGIVHLTANDKASCLNAAFAAQCSAPPAPSPSELDDQPPPAFSFEPVDASDVLGHMAALRTHMQVARARRCLQSPAERMCKQHSCPFMSCLQLITS